jgi:hypothetical protein
MPKHENESPAALEKTEGRPKTAYIHTSETHFTEGSFVRISRDTRYFCYIRMEEPIQDPT